MESLKDVCEQQNMNFVVSYVIEEAVTYWSKFSWLTYAGKDQEGMHFFYYIPEE